MAIRTRWGEIGTKVSEGDGADRSRSGSDKIFPQVGGRVGRKGRYGAHDRSGAPTASGGPNRPGRVGRRGTDGAPAPGRSVTGPDRSGGGSPRHAHARLGTIALPPDPSAGPGRMRQ